VTTDDGFAGQESDVDQACAAFGLDTLNYRAFPNAGPLPARVAAPRQPIAAPPPQPAAPPPPHFPPASPAPHFPLLAQAIPTAVPMRPANTAFAMARSPLRAPAVLEKPEQPAAPGINPAAFGAAFGAAYTAAFGHGVPQLPAAFPPSPRST
jgi:hypothetical protein